MDNATLVSYAMSLTTCWNVWPKCPAASAAKEELGQCRELLGKWQPVDRQHSRESIDTDALKFQLDGSTVQTVCSLLRATQFSAEKLLICCLKCRTRARVSYHFHETWRSRSVVSGGLANLPPWTLRQGNWCLLQLRTRKRFELTDCHYKFMESSIR